jgi:hypothetical protein
MDALAVGRRYVQIDDRPAAQVAEVVVESPPRLVVHSLDHELLSLRKLDQPGGRVSQRRDGVLHERDDELGRHGDLAPPRLVPLVQRAGSRQELVQPLVSRGV